MLCEDLIIIIYITTNHVHLSEIKKLLNNSRLVICVKSYEVVLIVPPNRTSEHPLSARPFLICGWPHQHQKATEEESENTNGYLISCCIPKNFSNLCTIRMA